MNLLKQTKQLIAYMKELEAIFNDQNHPENFNDHHFFKIVKEETDPIFQSLSRWEKDAKEFLINNQVKVFLPQIIATKENIEVLILHSYYKDLRKRLYMERYNSVLYVLENLLSELERVKEK